MGRNWSNLNIIYIYTMDIIYILKIISIILFPIILGMNVWNVYTKRDDKADTTAWYRNGIFDIADEFPDLFTFMIKIGLLLGILFFMIKSGPGVNSNDHGMYYSLSATLFITLIIARFLISNNGNASLSFANNTPLTADPNDSGMVNLRKIVSAGSIIGINIKPKDTGINLPPNLYITYFFSLLLVFLMIIERIYSNVKWDFSDFSLPIPIIGDIICGSTAHHIMQFINMYLFIVISAYVIYQFKLLKVRKICPPGTSLSICYPPKKALSRLPTTKCEKGIKPVCNKDPYINCSVDENGIITGDGINKIILTHDNDNKVIISPNNKTQITSDCKKDIESKILPKLKYT